MLTPRSLPLPFLVPAWTVSQLQELRFIHSKFPRDKSSALQAQEAPDESKLHGSAAPRAADEAIAYHEPKVRSTRRGQPARLPLADDHGIYWKRLSLKSYSLVADSKAKVAGHNLTRRVENNGRDMSHSKTKFEGIRNTVHLKKPSLFEELFPAEARKRAQNLGNKRDVPNHEAREAVIPPLEPPNLEDFAHTFISFKPSKKAAYPPKEIPHRFRSEQLTMLVVQNASTGLVDADFRQIAPRGEHIEEWRGPGDILKVIPARNAYTLEPLNRYFLLFNNPAYANIYYKHVLGLHEMSKAYTPCSLQLPVIPPGTLVRSQDVQSALKDYTLSAFEHPLIDIRTPPFSASVGRVWANKGYPQLTQPIDRTNRSVLFWIDGWGPSTASVKSAIAKNGSDRGLQWSSIEGTGSVELLSSGRTFDEPLDGDEEGEVRESKGKVSFLRWIITFKDEAEARRFVRTWHRMPFTFSQGHDRPPRGEPAPLVHAEFLW